MRTQQQVVWVMLAGLLIAGSMGCQIVTQVDRKLIPSADGGAGGQGEGGGGTGGGQGGQGGQGGG
jgi:hypothetical protein